MGNRNTLIVIDRGGIRSLCLDAAEEWEAGRMPAGGGRHITIDAPAVSRRHGRFYRIDGFWLYGDLGSTNGTFVGLKSINPSWYGSVVLEEGQVLIFGGPSFSGPGSKTAWALFTSRSFEGPWTVLDTSSYRGIEFSDGWDARSFARPVPGSCFITDNGMGIYMGKESYVTGKMTAAGRA